MHIKLNGMNRWFRIWSFFLASSTITSRQGGASVFQITLHKNLNGFKRVEGVPTHIGIHFDKDKEFSFVLFLSFVSRGFCNAKRLIGSVLLSIDLSSKGFLGSYSCMISKEEKTKEGGKHPVN